MLGLIFLHGLFRYAKEDKDKVEKERDDYKDRLAAYEDRDTTKVVASAENGGPVVLDVAHENRGPSHCQTIRHEAGGEMVDGRSYDTFLVPYKPHNSALSALDEPALVFKAEGVDDVFLVALTYEARSTVKRSEPEGIEDALRAAFTNEAKSPEELPPGLWFQPQATVWVQVLDEDKHLAREPEVHAGPGTAIHSDRPWDHVVSSSYTLSGLSRGVYGLNVYEEMDRSMGAREYLDMRLTVTKLFSAATPH